MNSLLKIALFCLIFCGFVQVGFGQNNPLIQKSANPIKLATTKTSNIHSWTTDTTGLYTILKEETIDLVYTKVGRNNITGEVLTYTSQMPQFPGGPNELTKFLTKNTTYPKTARKNKESGTVFTQFTITKTGKITDIKILKGVSDVIDQEVLRVINLMPDFIPAKENDEPVTVLFNLPFKFNL